MSEFDEIWTDFDDEDDYLVREKAEADQRATADASFDYFDAFPPNQPKFEVGQYVADQGFKVPLISDQAEWEKAFDEGTAMLRSEMPQDYDGLSGLLPSERLIYAELARHTEGFGKEVGSLVMRGLRSGELSPTEYMTYLRGRYRNWAFSEAEHVKTAARFGALDLLNMHSATASKWRYVEGTNVSIFADPHVEGRYHFGVKPFDPQQPERYQSIGGYEFDSGEYDTPKKFRKHDIPFVARPFVEFYEQIRNLPRFDATQCPVLEVQRDVEGNIYFLQYLKTGQRQQLTEPFDLPSSDDTLRTLNVRGITTPDGRSMRMYVAPMLLTKGMEGQAIFCGLIQPRRLETQLATKVASFILHEAYISFQSNHFDTSPLIRPPLAAGLSALQNSPESVFDKVDKFVNKGLFQSVPPSSRKLVPFIDIKVTSNGREAAIESDWMVNVTAYDDVR